MSRVHLIKRTITQPHPIPLEFILDYSFLPYCNNVPCNVLQNYCNIWTKNGNHDLRTWWDMHCIYPNAPMVYNASKAHINFHFDLVSLYSYSEIHIYIYIYKCIWVFVISSWNEWKKVWTRNAKRVWDGIFKANTIIHKRNSTSM